MISALLDDDIEEQLRSCVADMRAILAELNEKKAKVSEKLTAEKETMEAAIAEAEDTARAHLAALKEARKKGAEA